MAAPKQVGTAVPEVDPGRWAVVPEERDQGPGSEAAIRRAGPWSDDGETDGGCSPDAGGQHVEAVEQVEPVDQEDPDDHDQGHTDPAREVDGHGDGDESAHPQLGRQAQRRRKAEAVVGDPDRQGGGQAESGSTGRPAHGADDQPGEDGHPAQVGHGRFVGLERPGAVDDAEPVGGHDAHRYGNRRDNEPRRQRRGGVSFTTVRVPAEGATASGATRCPDAARTAPPHGTRPAGRARSRFRCPPRRPRARRPQPRRSISARNPSHQERSRPSPAHGRIDGDGQQFRAHRRPSPVPWRRVSMTRRQERRSRPAQAQSGHGAVTPQEGPVEAATSVEPARKPDRGRPVLDDEQKGAGSPGDPSVEPGQEARAEDRQESLADLPGVEGGGRGGVSHRSGAKQHALWCARAHRPRRLRKPAVARPPRHTW